MIWGLPPNKHVDKFFLVLRYNKISFSYPAYFKIYKTGPRLKRHTDSC
jgi:hypothetical protein